MTAAELPLSTVRGRSGHRHPADGKDSGRGRIFLRIGLGDASWTGSFERGEMCVSTISMMPDGKHLFVSADGAGYIIDLKSRTLVEQIGTDVAGVMRDDPMTVFVVDHAGISLEAFGSAGRLWKTAAEDFAEWRSPMTGYSAKRGRPRRRDGRFSVQLATGEVRFADAR